MTIDTVVLYRKNISRFSSWMPEFIGDITVEHIERYFTDYKITNRSKNMVLTTVRSFFRTVSQWYDLDNVAERIPFFKEEPPRQRIISDEEYKKVIDVCLPEEAKIIRFLALTGLRDTELRNLQDKNIDPSCRFLTITGKGRKRRVVPLAPSIQTNHLNFLKSIRKKGQLYYLCKRLSIKAGVPVAGPHSYRHRFATNLIKKGVPLAKVSRILGHSSTNFTERIYCHLSGSDLLGCTDCLDG
jgi:integrase/recombinase XerD